MHLENEILHRIENIVDCPGKCLSIICLLSTVESFLHIWHTFLKMSCHLNVLTKLLTFSQTYTQTHPHLKYLFSVYV